MPEDLPLLFEQCHEAIDQRDSAKLHELTENLHYADLAALYEDLDEDERPFYLESLGTERFTDVLAELPNLLVGEAIDHFEPSQQREILESLPDDDLVDVLQDVNPRKLGSYVSLLDDEAQEHTRALLRYGSETAGGRMTTQVGKIQAKMTVKEAIESLRPNLESTETLARIFVVDKKDRLIGRVRLRDLAFNPWETPIKDLLEENEHSILATADQEKAATIIKKYDMFALPVVDEENRLLGVITHDDAMEILEEESTEDIEKIAGISGDQSEESYLNTTLGVHFRRRAGWLTGLALLAIISGYVMLRFEELLNSAFLLSLFLPMVIAAGGNTGGQASTMVIRAMALGEVDLADLPRIAWKELRLGLLLGSFLACVLGAVILFVLPAFQPPMPEGVSFLRFATSVSVAMGTQVATSALIGALLPLAARSLKLDPAVIAAPAITTIVDASGMFIYFALARLLLGL
ncbi:MAG: magnesium transporter [Verrucomicrobiales bacterium]